MDVNKIQNEEHALSAGGNAMMVARDITRCTRPKRYRHVGEFAIDMKLSNA